MSRSIPRIVIAGTQSGAGKTSLALALTKSLERRGLRVQTFKVGPDFLDPTYLTLASGRPCYNLDSWMTGKEYILELFLRKTVDADIAVIEGVMGLFDGSDPANSEGSTAEIACCLNAPVLLVVNVHGMARSLAAIVKGCVEFEQDLRIAGVIANHSGSDLHKDWLTQSLESASLPPLLGAIPRGALPTLPSRHLGLITADPQNLSPTILEELTEAFEKHLSLDVLLQIA
ncbi:MAG: cobyrinate a,c-diamide synthase, partial [Thermodesulfobacteriota bacterium]